MPRRKRARKVQCGNGGCIAVVELDQDGARLPCATCIKEGRVLKWTQRYHAANGKMSDFLPGGSKYTGAIHEADVPKVEEDGKGSSVSASSQPPIANL